MKILSLAIVGSSLFLINCSHFSKSTVEPRSTRKPVSISSSQVVEFTELGITVIIKEVSEGVPIAAIFDKSGEFYPELQSEINTFFKSRSQSNLVILSSEVISEEKLYKESQEKYATLIIKAKTRNALINKEENLKFAVPLERMILSQKGIKAKGLGYWNTTNVRALDPQQSLPF